MMKNWIAKHPIKIIVLGVLIALVSLASLNYSGFCIPQGRWLTDEEKIRLAASAVANNGPTFNYLNDHMRKALPESETRFRNFEVEYTDYRDETIWKEIPGGGFSRIGRANVDDFMRQNPNCCKVVGSEGKPFVFPPFWWRILGNYDDVVEVRYTARFKDIKTRKPVYLKDYTEYPVITNCGYVFTQPAI